MSKIFIEGSITGHASPKWESPGEVDKDKLNKQLSIDRAEQVETFAQEIFKRNLSAKGIDVEFAVECTQEKDFDKVQLPATGVGDSVTLEEAGGDENANEDAMRRADINIVVTHQIESETGMSFNIHIPEKCEDNATTKWSIRLGFSGGAGHAGIGGALAYGEIRNRKTGQVAEGFFAGAGIGVGLQIPDDSIQWGDWVDFKTDQKITFDHLDGTLCRLTSAGGGIYFAYNLIYISFPLYGANSISVGGFSKGVIGADMGSNVGFWKFFSFPGARCIPAEDLPGEEFMPYTYDIKDDLSHKVHFETGSSEISVDEINKLETFITHITDKY